MCALCFRLSPPRSPSVLARVLHREHAHTLTHTHKYKMTYCVVFGNIHSHTDITPKRSIMEIRFIFGFVNKEFQSVNQYINQSIIKKVSKKQSVRYCTHLRTCACARVRMCVSRSLYDHVALLNQTTISLSKGELRSDCISFQWKAPALLSFSRLGFIFSYSTFQRLACVSDHRSTVLVKPSYLFIVILLKDYANRIRYEPYQLLSRCSLQKHTLDA